MELGNLEELAEAFAVESGWLRECPHGNSVLGEETFDADELRSGGAASAETKWGTSKGKRTAEPAVHYDADELSGLVETLVGGAELECPIPGCSAVDDEEIVDGGIAVPESRATVLTVTSAARRSAIEIRGKAAIHEAGHVVAIWNSGERGLGGAALTSVDDLLRATTEIAGTVVCETLRRFEKALAFGLLLGRSARNLPDSTLLRARHSLMVSVAGAVCGRRALATVSTAEMVAATFRDVQTDMSKGWENPRFALLELVSRDRSDTHDDYENAISIARLLADGGERGAKRLVNQSLWRAARLFFRPEAWRAAQRIAAALRADGEISAVKCFSICHAERVPFAANVPKSVQLHLQDLARGAPLSCGGPR